MLYQLIGPWWYQMTLQNSVYTDSGNVLLAVAPFTNMV